MGEVGVGKWAMRNGSPKLFQGFKGVNERFWEIRAMRLDRSCCQQLGLH